MKMNLFNILNTINIFTIFVSFFVLLTIPKQVNVPKNLRLLYLYPLGAILVFFVYLMSKLNILLLETYFRFNYITLVYHLSFLCFFIIYELKENKLKTISKYVYFLFCTLLILVLIFKPNEPHLGIATSYLGLLIISTFYFIDIFINVPKIRLSNLPSFWIIVGIFINMIFGIPTSTLFFYVKKNQPELLNVFAILIVASSTFMYLMFIKGGICFKKHHQF